MKTIAYARVSRDDMHCENQKKILDEWHAKNQCDKYLYLQEEQSTRKSRPVKEKAIRLLREGQYDTLVVVRIDRFARSTIELIQDVEGIVNQGNRFISINNGFDFQRGKYNASQQLQLSMFAAFAEFERALIQERTLEGLARAKAQGKIGGRHPVDCGCGMIDNKGKRHNGTVKPLRDKSNKIIAWQGLDEARAALKAKRNRRLTIEEQLAIIRGPKQTPHVEPTKDIEET